MATILYDNVSKHSPEASLHDCSLEIRDKDFFVFLGPAGSGKSTAIRCLQGLLDLDAGRILLNGQDVAGLTPMERNLRSVGPTFALYPDLNVHENLAFWFKNRGVPATEVTRQVQEVAEQLSLQSLLDRRPNQLTSDQRFNVTLGRVMLQKPAAFIFKTEISGLEPAPFERIIENLIRFWRMSGLTCIYSTESSKTAMRLGTRIAVLKDGRVQQVGTPQELVRRPGNAFVAELIGPS